MEILLLGDAVSGPLVTNLDTGAQMTLQENAFAVNSYLDQRPQLPPWNRGELPHFAAVQRPSSSGGVLAGCGGPRRLPPAGGV